MGHQGVRASGRQGVVSNAKQSAGHEYIGLLCPQPVLTVNRAVLPQLMTYNWVLRTTETAEVRLCKT